jgi:branched-subunit amino acid aminotransferase/4-amino-4-deoxychorismate lyase
MAVSSLLMNNSLMYPRPSSSHQYWWTGQLHFGNTLELSLDDPAFLYGATVFTTLRVYRQNPQHPLTALEAHLHRLEVQVDALGWESPSWEQVNLAVQTLAPYYPVLRITLLPDGRELVTGRALPPDLAQKQQTGVVLLAVEGGRSWPHLKTGNYLVSFQALRQAGAHGAKEAILMKEGTWLETSRGNLWAWDGSQYLTPPEEGCLAGIFRQQLLSTLANLQIPHAVLPFTPERQRSFRAVGYSNSVVELLPVREIIEAELSGAARKDFKDLTPMHRLLQYLYETAEL